MTDKNVKNLYRLEKRDGNGYAPASKLRVNTLVENGQAIWIGTDYDEDRDAYVHYADRVR